MIGPAGRGSEARQPMPYVPGMPTPDDLTQDAHARERKIRGAASDAAATLERFAASRQTITQSMVLAVAQMIRQRLHEA